MATRKTREWGILQDGAWDWRRVYHALGLDIASQKIPADAQPNQVIYRGVKVTLLPPRAPRTRTRRTSRAELTGYDADGLPVYDWTFGEETRNIGTGKTRITVECGCGKVVGYGRMCQHAMACDDARSTLCGVRFLCNCIECVQNDRWMEYADCPTRAPHAVVARHFGTDEDTVRRMLSEYNRDEPEENPAEAPQAGIWVYIIEKTGMDGITWPRWINAGIVREESCPFDDDQHLDLAQALALAERSRGIDRWVVVAEDDGRAFMSVLDSEFVEVTENLDEGSSWRDCRDMLLPEPNRGNPDGSAPNHEALGPVDEESDVPERYKKIFHKRVAEAEEEAAAAALRPRSEVVARVKKDLRLPKQNPCTACDENPRDEPEAGDRVTRYKAQGSLRGVEGTVVSLISHPKLNWVVALVHWDNGEKREHPMHVLQLVPRKSTRNPEDFVEDGVDPRYVGWDVPEDEEPHTSVGLPSYENVPTFLAPDEDRPLLERMFSRADTAMEMAGQTLRKLRKNGTHDQPDYHWYVVDLTEKRILSGWSYREDAGDARRETEAEHPFEDPARFKVVFESRLAKLGLDPDNDRSWELAPVPQEVILLVYELHDITDNWYPRSTFAEVREAYRDLPEALAEAQKLRDIDKLVLIDAEGPIWMVSAGDSEFETIDDGQVPNWRELVERLLNG